MFHRGLRKNPDTRGAPPSLLRMFVNLCHNTRTFARFLNTAGKSFSIAEITRPKYLKDVTISRGRQYALKYLGVTAFSSSDARYCLFFSAPFLHCVVRQYILF